MNIDGRPWFAKHSIDNGEQEEIAAIDADLIKAAAAVSDEMR